MPEAKDSISALPQDSIAAATDTLDLTAEGETACGIILTDPGAAYAAPASPHVTDSHWGEMSWVYLALAVMFCAIGIKFKGNSRYMKALYDDLTDTRLRSNLFDETVKETSLLVLLNLMWVLNVGIMLWGLVEMSTPAEGSLPRPESAPVGIAICVGVTAVYQGLMYVAYWIVGNVFSDRVHTRLWVKGAAASTGMGAFLMFPLSLMSLIYPGWRETILIVAACVFAVGKIVFLYKGFRIFFAEISSWLLFLYYLCSLEIVPLVLTYIGAVLACASAW